jgi:hypothetical protein
MSLNPAVLSALRTLETEQHGIAALAEALKGDLSAPFTAPLKRFSPHPDV